MKWIKLFEDFKKNNEEGTLITQDDIINCIKNGRCLDKWIRTHCIL